jgi:hypothetical protein
MGSYEAPSFSLSRILVCRRQGFALSIYCHGLAAVIGSRLKFYVNITKENDIVEPK